MNEQTPASRSARANAQVQKSTADIVVESMIANGIDTVY